MGVRPDLTIIPDLTRSHHHGPSCNSCSCFLCSCTHLRPSHAKALVPGRRSAGLRPGKMPTHRRDLPHQVQLRLDHVLQQRIPHEGEECDAAAADAAEGNPCRPAAGGEGYERKKSFFQKKIEKKKKKKKKKKKS